jgi:hypothetical protein
MALCDDSPTSVLRGDDNNQRRKGVTLYQFCVWEKE